MGKGGILELGMRAGKWGIAGIFLAAIGELVQFLYPDSTRMDSLTHFCMWAGVGLALIGMQSHAKRATDIAVTVAAEAKIDRAEISKALPGPNVMAQSADPAVQKVIERTLRASK